MFLPQPSSVESTVCVDIGDRNTKLQFYGVDWSHGHPLPHPPPHQWSPGDWLPPSKPHAPNAETKNICFLSFFFFLFFFSLFLSCFLSLLLWLLVISEDRERCLRTVWPSFTQDIIPLSRSSETEGCKKTRQALAVINISLSAVLPGHGFLFKEL